MRFVGVSRFIFALNWLWFWLISIRFYFGFLSFFFEFFQNLLPPILNSLLRFSHINLPFIRFLADRFRLRFWFGNSLNYSMLWKRFILLKTFTFLTQDINSLFLYRGNRFFLLVPTPSWSNNFFMNLNFVISHRKILIFILAFGSREISLLFCPF